SPSSTKGYSESPPDEPPDAPLPELPAACEGGVIVATIVIVGVGSSGAAAIGRVGVGAGVSVASGVAVGCSVGSAVGGAATTGALVASGSPAGAASCAATTGSAGRGGNGLMGSIGLRISATTSTITPTVASRKIAVTRL